MKIRLIIIVICIFSVSAGSWIFPAWSDDSTANQEKTYYLKCINNEIESYSCKVQFTTSRSTNLQGYGEQAALRTVYLSKNKEALVQEMIAQKVSMRPHAVHQYLLQRCNQEIGSAKARKGP
jgi:hypothetical protein